MEDEYEDTVPCDDTVAFESPCDLDMNTEVLDVCDSSQSLGDQMDVHCEKEVALDSDEEGGSQNEAVNLVNGHFPVIGRLSGRNAKGLLRRRRVPAGCFRRLDNKDSEHVHLGSARSKRSDGETSHYDDTRSRKYHVVVDSEVSKSLDQKSIPSDFLNLVRESFMEESLDERKLSSHQSKSMDVGKDTNYDCKVAELNYIGSSQSAESQDKALRFVDHFLSVSDLGSCKEIQSRKTNMIKSPPSLWSKGSQSLAMRVSLGSSDSKLKTFDWAEKQTKKDEYTSLRMNKDSIFGFKDAKSGCLSVNEESDNVKLRNKSSSLQSKEKMAENISSLFDLNTDSLNSIESDNIGSNSDIRVAYDSVELEKQHDAGITNQNVEKIEQFGHVPDALDIGLDTQVAIEAMEELIHAVPPSFDACFTHQGSLSDNKCKLNHVANYEETFVGWRSKRKRSKFMKNSTIQDKRSSKDFQKHHCLCGRRSKETADGTKSVSSSRLRKMFSFHEDIHTCLKSDIGSSFQAKADTAKREKTSNLNVADRTCSKLNLWVYPKGKRARQRTPRHSVSSSNECSPSVANEHNVEKCPTSNEEAYKGVPKLLVYKRRVPKLLVYKRRRKSPLGRDQIGTPLTLVGAASDKQVSVRPDTGKSSMQCDILDDRKPSSLETSSNMKSNLMSDEHSMTLQVLEGSDKRKQPSNPISRSPLMAELTRLGYTGSLPDFLQKDSRKRRAMEKVCVLLSQNLEKGTLKQQKKIVSRLGLSIASSCSNATHFVADKFVRTRNMLEAIALGKPVVTHLWLESCEQAGCVIHEKSFILRDEKKEKEVGFNMPITLSRASKLPLLKGRIVVITPNVKPSVDVINTLVKAVQGEVVQNIPTAKTKDKLIPDDFLIISCEEDYTISLQYLEKGASVYDSELLLHGIVTQKLDYERYRLFEDL